MKDVKSVIPTLVMTWFLFSYKRMAKKKQGHSQESQCWKKMRKLKFHLKDSAKLKNNNPPPASPGTSPSIMSPAAVSSMRVSEAELDKPSTEWRKRKKRLRFSQFLEVRSRVSQQSAIIVLLFNTSRSRCLKNTTGKSVSPGQS